MSALRYAMIGGGPDALIGGAHRAAAGASGFELVAGAFSSDADKSRAQATALNLDPTRGYATWVAMIAAESTRPDGARAAVLVTPNHLHAGPAHAALDAGWHVICDKPLCITLEEARALQAHAREAKRVFGVTYTYAGYAAVTRAADIVRSGALGKLRLVEGQFVQDWLTTKLEDAGLKMAAWRMDPARAGQAGATADIGTHLWHLAETISGETPNALSAELTAFVDGRLLDDTALVRARYASGARASFTISQATPSSRGHVYLRVYGANAGLEWRLERPHELLHLTLGGPPEVERVETSGPLPEVPGTRPGFLNAFAALYAGYAAAIRGAATPYVDVAAGVSGVAFIDACVRSSRADSGWISL